MPSRPETLSVFEKQSTRRTLRAEIMIEGIGLVRGKSGRVRSIGIAERKISRKVKTKKTGFISRKTSYRTIRAKKE